MIELGEAYNEVELEMFLVERYPTGKTEWIKWKKMLSRVSKSDMKFNTLLELTVYNIFEEGGLYDQGQTYLKKELAFVKEAIKNTQLWEMNMKRPVYDSRSNYKCYEGRSDGCEIIRKWITAGGVSEDAADMKDFRVKNEKNVTLAEIDTHLDVFDDYEKKMLEKEPEAETYAKLAMLALETDIAELEKLFNNKNRILADDLNIDMEFESTSDNAMQVGEDNQIEDTEVEKDVTEISQTSNAEELAAVDAVSNADSGVVGPNSDEDYSGSDDGWSFMTWLMVIGGVLLVFALVSAGCYLMFGKKEENVNMDGP